MESDYSAWRKCFPLVQWQQWWRWSWFVGNKFVARQMWWGEVTVRSSITAWVEWMMNEAAECEKVLSWPLALSVSVCCSGLIEVEGCRMYNLSTPLSWLCECVTAARGDGTYGCVWSQGLTGCAVVEQNETAEFDGEGKKLVKGIKLSLWHSTALPQWLVDLNLPPSWPQS